jgi:LPXTG-site transpeptidase (sortase) family protein
LAVFGTRRARWAAGAALAVVVLAGCNGAGTGSGAAGAGTPTGPARDTPSATATATAAPAARPAAALPRSAPERLRIPRIGVDTSVIPLGLAADGTVQVPPIRAHSPAGWYDGSPTPGQTGPAVLLGHVTVGRYGDGVFRHLDRMRPGDEVTVDRADGSVATFAVERVQTVPKSRFPTQQVYGNVDHPALRLITCGGTKLSGGAGYTDNVIVYASLIDGS